MVVDPCAVRRWHLVLQERLRGDAEVRFRAGGAGPVLPGAVNALLALEKLVLRRGRDALFDHALAPSGPWWTLDDEVDLIIDLDGRETLPSETATLRPVFDGTASEITLISALLAGTMPELAVVDPRDGSALAIGRPSSESVGGLTGSLDAALSRTMLLVEAIVTAPKKPDPRPAPSRRAHGPARPVSVLLGGMARQAAYAAYKLCMYTPHWRVGWRVNDGPGVSERLDLGGPSWRRLPDPGHRFFADPFPIVWQGREAILFEDLDHRVGKGVISAVELTDGSPGAPSVVLEEPWHLSYPFLIAEAGRLYMLPEASLSGEVVLYRCIEFPARWERCATLLTGIEAADATIVRHGGRHWMFAVTREGRGGYSDTLRIWHAPGLFGPWEEHRLRPVLIDAASARPAGSLQMIGGSLWRPFQDCQDGYGRALGLARVNRLDPDHFDETVLARVTPGASWPGRRLHTLNRWGRLECIDGSALMPKAPALRRFAALRERPHTIDP